MSYVATLSSTIGATPTNVAGAFARGDFNDDGALERVVSSPEDNCNKGAVYVSDSGGSAAKWTRDVSGVLGTAACDDYFGAAVAVGDFDGDGYDDLAIAAPGGDDSGESSGGAVHVLYGSSTGLTATADQLWHQDSTGIEGVGEVDDQIGEALTAGDFNCDGYDDLVIGVPMEDLSPDADAGAVHVLYGSSGGVTSTNDLYYQGAAGVDGAAEAGDRFGEALAAGNFNGDSSASRPCHDLAIASARENIGSIVDAGFVHTLLGGTSGLSTTGEISFSQDTSGVDDAAQTGDLFGTRLYTGDENGDGYDDIAVVVPGDSCVAGHGFGKHVFRGSSSGITLAGDRLDCDLFRCNLVEDDDTYACPSYGAPVFASSGADTIKMFVGDDIVFADAGADQVATEHGADVVFGGAGNDTIDAGAGLDVLIGGAGNDTFTLDLGCEAIAGKVFDGGPGTDTLRSHLSASALATLGVTLSSIESYVTVPEVGGSCNDFPYEEGPMRPPRVALAWDDLPNPDSQVTTTTGIVELDLTNTSSVAVSVELVFRLHVQGYVAEFAPAAISLSATASTSYNLDLNDFVPAGVDPGDVDPALLDLPTSAILSTRARIKVAGVHRESTYAPTLYGHLEEGDTAVIYRWDTYHTAYHSGNLLGWRDSQTPYRGSARLMGVVEARVVPPD